MISEENYIQPKEDDYKGHGRTYEDDEILESDDDLYIDLWEEQKEES